jgi:hypothetical protein
MLRPGLERLQGNAPSATVRLELMKRLTPAQHRALQVLLNFGTASHDKIALAANDGRANTFSDRSDIARVYVCQLRQLCPHLKIQNIRGRGYCVDIPHNDLCPNCDRPYRTDCRAAWCGDCTRMFELGMKTAKSQRHEARVETRAVRMQATPMASHGEGELDRPSGRGKPAEGRAGNMPVAGQKRGVD